MKIAIQGHPTRGKEVIQILESLGGENRINHSGRHTKYFYYIKDNNNTIVWSEVRPQHLRVFTLEEFEKEFPFKIGDKVIDYEGDVATITGFVYIEENLGYSFQYENGRGVAIPRILTPYKEMKKERNITLTLDKAKEWYKKGGELKEIALQAYSEEELTKLELPKTWEEFCNKFPVKPNEAFIYITGQGESDILSFEGIQFTRKHNIKHMCASQKSAEAHLAMIQLERLRDCYRNSIKMHCSMWYKIYRSNNKYAICPDSMGSFLSFPTESLAIQFLNNFKDLIIKAGDLI